MESPTVEDCSLFNQNEPSQTAGACLREADDRNRDGDDNDQLSESIYCFETDHVALKGNRDYHNLLKTVVMLEAQRTKAIKDLDDLLNCRDIALSDPIEYVNKLQQGVDTGLPRPQEIAQIPNIHWEQYTSNVDMLNFGKHKHMTRNKKAGDSNDVSRANTPEPNIKQEGGFSLRTEVVRGRVKDVSKSVTFNKLWSAEEQKRLEDCLIQFPPEEVEAKRWSKIAKALGNRTTAQVASRVQKYFIKLAKAGLPIPGRMPNMNAYLKKGSSHKHQRFNKFYYQPSTFLQAYEPPVYMSDDEDDARSFACSMEWETLTQNSQEDVDISDEEDVPLELRDSAEYAELMRLKKMKKQKMLEENSHHHIGYKCDRCNTEPIGGTRWHCSDCPIESSVDFCEECVDSQYENGTHNSSHRLDPVYLKPRKEAHLDRDYSTSRFMPGDYNYLDPNYMPAS